MKVIRSVALTLAAMVSYTSPAFANDKLNILQNQVSVIPEARELQDQREFLCLALNVYHEARGESLAGKNAVAHVVVNRRDSGRFPQSLCAVTWQRSQFSWTVRSARSLIPRESFTWNQCQQIALNVISGRSKDPTAGATYFSGSRVPGVRGTIIRIGRHVFTRTH